MAEDSPHEKLFRMGFSPSRRLTSRVEAPTDVWVYWECSHRKEVSRVRNVGMGGLFLETQLRFNKGLMAKLHFLVDEGQIRAEAAVRHTTPGKGLGMRFTAVHQQDRPQLAALLSRLRSVR
ncbi:MAG TPA: PilZ domain-containing protein [Verrucomicrobiae bacterium]|nr:PilZ domain-containing protein [Verrucomicrobiae bacterium]